LVAPIGAAWPSAGRSSAIGPRVVFGPQDDAERPERTLAAIRAIGYTEVELLWSFNNFDRTAAQVAATLKNEGLRAPSAATSTQ